MSPPRNVGHYRIVAKLGEGGMGEVWRATDTKLGRDVAIKILPDAFAQDADRMMRFTREAQVLASLNHPHIAAIYGVEERALIMELVDGPTLAERIRQGPIPLSEALPIAKEIAMALEYAHEKNIIHRDLKPANIKLTVEGHAKVLDFGLAKALSNDPAAGDPAASPTLTMRATLAGVILGTAAYMSPEQARGAAADRRSDIWSFGVMLYEMLTGRQIFGGETVSDSLAAVLKTDPDWSALPPETPAAIRRLLRRALERDRKRRLPDIADARLEIDEALTAPTEAPAPQAAPPHPRRASDRLSMAVAVSALIGLAALALVHFRETTPQPTAIRFEIPPPDKSGFEKYGMAVAPDGRRLAFIASGSDGRSMLWLRPLDGITAQPLPGTQGAAYMPVWSPDSRSLVFFDQGRLKRIEASGGPVQTLCDVGGLILGGSWSPAGVILFGTSTGSLYRVPQAGGIADRFEQIDSAHGEIGHLRPWFLPDGRHYLYWSRNQNAEESAIYVAALDSRQRKPLIKSRQAGAFVPAMAGSGRGHLLFLRESTLMAQPFDLGRLELSGEPVPVAERVGSLLAMGFFGVSANGVLAYRSGEANNNTRLAWFDRTGKFTGAIGPGSTYDALALSPDEKRVAVDAPDLGHTDLWIVDIARGVPTRFTFDTAIHLVPVWTPDSRRLLFGSDKGAGNRGQLATYQKDASSSGDEQLLLKSGVPWGWSRDGRHLIYGVLKAAGRSDLWVATFSEKGEIKEEPYLETAADERQGQFSPDGRWIAYLSDETGPGQYRVYVQSYPPGAGKFQVSTGSGLQPRWRRDGKELYFIAADGMLMAVDVKLSPKFEAGIAKPLFLPRMIGFGLGYNSYNYDVASDGRFLVNTVGGLGESASVTPITVVVNWQAALPR